MSQTLIQNSLFIFILCASCLLLQYFFKEHLESDQYFYFKDISLVATIALMGIWMEDSLLRMTCAAAVVAACFGFCQRFQMVKNLEICYFIIGIIFSIGGTRVSFVEISPNEFYCISYVASIAIGALVFGLFPIALNALDDIPGLAGPMILSLWLVFTAHVLVFTGIQGDILFICLASLCIFFTFFRRQTYTYRRLTEPLTALWGVLFAGTFIRTVSCGIPLYSMLLMSFGFFLLLVTTWVENVFRFFISKNNFAPHMAIYSTMLSSGYTHSTAINVYVFCSIISSILLSLCGTGRIRHNIFFIMFVLSLVFIFFDRKEDTTMAVDKRHPTLWGIRADNVSKKFALSKVSSWFSTEKNTPHIIVTPDALAALLSRTDKRYANVVQNASLVLPDGMGLITALKFLRTPVQERIPGCEFTVDLAEFASKNDLKLAFLGGQKGVAEEATAKLKEQFPSLQVSYTRNGFFTAAQIDEICADIKSSGADILFVGLGVPKQEYWLYDNLQKTGATIGMGIGGTMDVLSGRLTRAPKSWQKLGLEWLYRVIQEPFRWKRIIKLPKFALLVIATFLHLDTYKNNTDK